MLKVRATPKLVRSLTNALQWPSYFEISFIDQGTSDGFFYRMASFKTFFKLTISTIFYFVLCFQRIEAS